MDTIDNKVDDAEDEVVDQDPEGDSTDTHRVRRRSVVPARGVTGTVNSELERLPFEFVRCSILSDLKIRMTCNFIPHPPIFL